MSSNVFASTPVQKTTGIQYSQDVTKDESPKFWSDTLPANLGYQYIPIAEAIRDQFKYRDEVEVGYNPLDDIDGYEQFASHLINARNPTHMSEMKASLDLNQERRRIMAESPFVYNLGAGIIDPINLVALPFGGAAASLGRQFLRSGASVGTLQAGLEVGRAPFDPLATPEEVAMNIGSAFVVGGIIGGAVSVPASRRASAIRKTNDELDDFLEVTGDLSQESAATIGNREARILGNETDEVLSTRRESLPKSIDALEESVNDLEVRIEAHKNSAEKAASATDELELKALRDEKKAKMTALDNNKKDLNNIRVEQQIRRAEDIQKLNTEDAHGMAKNWFTDSWMYKAVPSPVKRTLQGAIPDSVKKHMVKLGGDSGVLLKMHQLGIASPKSVYQYAQTHNGEWLQVYSSMLQSFGQHSGKGVSTFTDLNLSNIDGSFTTFAKEANRKYITGIKGATKGEQEAIELMANFYKEWEARLRETGQIGNVKKYQSQIINKEANLQKTIDKISELEGRADAEKAGLSLNQTSYLEILRTKQARLESELIDLEVQIAAAGDESSVPAMEEVMFPRYWDRDQISTRRQEFAQVLFDWYKENPEIYVPNPDAQGGNFVRNISQLSDGEIQLRFGEKFGVKKIVTDAKESIPAIGDKKVLGTFVYLDESTGIAYVNRTRAYKRYKELQEAMSNPEQAYANLAKLDPAKIQYHQRKYMLDNFGKFKNFNDFQDFVLLHELSHNIRRQEYKEDLISLEMRVNDSAIKYMGEIHADIRNRVPLFLKKTLATDDASVMKRVDETIDEILGITDVADDANAFYGQGKSKHFKHRKLDIPNALVFDFIEQDPLAVMRAYTMRTAPLYQFAKLFDGKSLDDLLEDIDDDMFAAGKSMKEMNRVRRDFTHMYDRVVGSVQRRDPTSFDMRAAKVLRDGAQLNYLGSAGFASITDFAKIMMEHELKDIFRGLFGLISDSRLRMTMKEASYAGEAREIIQGSSHMRHVDEISNNPFGEGNRIDRVYDKGVGKLKSGFFYLNGLGPLTNIMKKLDAVVRGHSIIQMSIRLADGNAKPFEIKYLARYGIDASKAREFKKLVDDGIIENTKENGSGLWLPNSDKWPTEAKDLQMEFRSSMNSGIMNTILMGTPADKPIIVDGVAYVPFHIARKFGYEQDPRVRGYSRIENGLLGLPFQFYSYSFAAANKITAAYATGQARNRAVAAVAAMGLGYLGLELKNRNRPFVMDNMSIQDKIARSFDMSGLAALWSDSFYTAMSTSAAFGGPDLGGGFINDRFPQEESFLDGTVNLLGAGPSYGQDVLTGLYKFTTGDFGEGSKDIIRALPTARLWLWNDYVNEFSNVLAGTLPNQEQEDYTIRRF